MRLGFACIWDRDPRRTWSYTPWDLREALKRRTDIEVVDVGFTLPTLLRRALQVASLRRRNHRWITPWKFMGVWQSALELELDRRAKALGCDVVLQIQDLGATSVPYMIYQDFSYDIAIANLLSGSTALREYFPSFDVVNLQKLRRRQLRIYEGATALLAMSNFLRHSLVTTTGVCPDKVVTVWPGVSTVAPVDEVGGVLIPERGAPRRRLLFVGTSFLVKGGDQLLEAFQILRHKDPSVTLTVAGPAQWPVQSPVPQGVQFLGRVDPEKLTRLYLQHDLLVVPSRLEGFGKVFVEALSHGVPCIGRRAFAMPELIQSGVNGDLVESDDPEELARRIERVLGDEGVYRNCNAARQVVSSTFNWDRAAADVVKVAQSIGRPNKVARATG
jgi:glycosyltransferase involved in cell wall biosynthesis